MTKLTEREHRFLCDMAASLPEDHCGPFKYLTDHCWLEPGDTARRVVRSLSRKGMTYFQRGLSSDDGELRGSGYGVTEKGYEYARQHMEDSY